MASMTPEEKRAKAQIRSLLMRSGYVTYAKLLDDFFINLTNRPGFIAGINLKTGVMELSRGLDADQVSVVVRHEIVHEYLQHIERLLRHIAQKQGLDYDELDDITLGELYRGIFKNKNYNYAGDFEISNRAYTDEDKEIVRQMSALVTEDHHPDWMNLSMEEMFDKLEEMTPPKIENVFGALKDPTTFVGIDGVVYGA